MDYKDILTGVAERLSSLRGERLSAGTKYRLMGMAADIAEVAETLSAEVLERVRHEAVLDVDADTDFDQLAEDVLSWELQALFRVSQAGGLQRRLSGGKPCEGGSPFLCEPQGGECQEPSQCFPEVHAQDLAGTGTLPEVAGSPVGKRGRGSVARRAGYRPGDEVLGQVCRNTVVGDEQLCGLDQLPPPALYPRKHRELLRAVVAVGLGIGLRKVRLHDLDAAYSIAFPQSTPLNVNKKKRH